MDVRRANLERWDFQHRTQGDPTMDVQVILKNLDNGTITQDAALDLLLKHAPQAYLAGAYLECREQCAHYRREWYLEQDKPPRPIMNGLVIADLIDHALSTGYITPVGARCNLMSAGMDADTAAHHVETILTIANRDASRANYLEHPDLAPRYCTRCGRKVKAGELSRRGICVECSTQAVEENLIALDTKTGPAYRRWRNAMLVWAYTLEDEEIAERPALDAGTLGDYIEAEVDTDLLYGVAD